MPLPSIRAWRWIVINSSSGKDSQTALRYTVQAADAAGVPRDRIVVSHQDLGRIEWDGCKDLAIRQAQHYGLRMEVSAYRNADGVESDLLAYVRRRGKWPDSQNRYCTSEFKRGPGMRVLTMLSREAPGPVLHVFGFRAEESPARRKRAVLALNARASNKTREVWDWLPIHEWTKEQVWEDIRASGVPYHPAYDLGMPRLSCCFCVFAPRAALIIAGQHNPGLLREYVQVEKEIGHDFQHKKPIREVLEAVERGEKAEVDAQGAWNM